jgi:hypothetical protein
MLIVDVSRRLPVNDINLTCFYLHFQSQTQTQARNSAQRRNGFSDPNYEEP